MRDGLYWPASDNDIAYKDIKDGIPTLRKAMEYCPEKRVAIQAGGNAGMYPRILGEEFQRVHTCEPEPLNYDCLLLNTAEQPHVIPYQVGLWNVAGLGHFSGPEANTGSYSMVLNQPGYNFAARLTTIDQLMLDHDIQFCDFLQLDIEGAEQNALMGAMNMLMTFWPVIMVERRKQGQDPDQFIRGMGYSRVFSTLTDTVYVR